MVSHVPDFSQPHTQSKVTKKTPSMVTRHFQRITTVGLWSLMGFFLRLMWELFGKRDDFNGSLLSRPLASASLYLPEALARDSYAQDFFVSAASQLESRLGWPKRGFQSVSCGLWARFSMQPHIVLAYPPWLFGFWSLRQGTLRTVEELVTIQFF
jgi:hypothetical protein